MFYQYVTKLQQQHSTMVSSVPAAVRAVLGMKAGDHIMWQVDEESDFVQVCKVVPGGKSHGGDSGDSDRKDSGG